MFLPSYLEDLSREILRIYEQIDLKVAAWQKATGIKCLPGCGQCCTLRNVKVTPLEFIPLARHLFLRRKVDIWWSYLVEKQEEICVFFREDLIKNKNGHCLVYPWRAATCRLYGFGVKCHKYGTLEPITCHFIKNDFYNVIKDLCRNNSIDLFPSYDSFMIQIVSLDPILGMAPLPVNQAIAKALEKYALVSQINSPVPFFLPQESPFRNDCHEQKE